MSSNKTKLMLIAASGLLALSAQVGAKTPDGQTPAEETICDQYNGALYGLCVAYCEAQDLDQFPKDPVTGVLERNMEKHGDVVSCRVNPD